jgi:hydrogenase/urease accessory protein HupE
MAMMPLAILVLSLCMVAEPALAHAPIKGIGTFYNGVLHPALVPAHLLLLIGLGLLIGQRVPRPSRYGWFAFVVAFWIGLAAGQALGEHVPETVLLALALLAGLLVILDRSFGTAVVVILATAAGLGIGLDSAPDSVQKPDSALALIGTAIGGVLTLSYVGGATAALVQPWQRIGIRIAGSWTAASAAIVLVLVLAGPRGAG